MSDDYESDDGEEAFNSDFDDGDTTLRAGVANRMCPNCKVGLDFRVEGRFVVRFCKSCDYEIED
jgi:uncharacterized protein (DUF983 family)